MLSRSNRHIVSRTLLWLVLVALSGWALLALHFDLQPTMLSAAVSLLFALIAIAAMVVTRAGWRGFAVWGGLIVVVLVWWLQLKPSNAGNWQPDVAELAWAETSGDQVTIHNVRNCDYRSETDFTARWETKTFSLRDVRGVDLFLVHWGSPWIAHAILSFDLGGSRHLAISIEARKRIGQSYSALRGFFRQYTLIYVFSEERDVVCVRTNFRQGEDVRLYRTKTTAHDAQHLLRAYLGWISALHDQPEWYNALTTNCTSGIVEYLREQKIGGLPNWDWRTLLNGRGDEMLYQIGDLVSDGLPFAELQKRALINPAAQRADDSPDFSRRIRAGRPGFTASGEPEMQ